jgi:hypothetical protein
MWKANIILGHMFIGGDKPDVREASISGRREATRGAHQREWSRSPSGNRGMCRGLCLATTDPPHSCEVEAMVELMTVRLAELVNARMSEE